MDRSNVTGAGSQREIFVDANPLADRHLTGIGRYTARVSLALAAQRGPVRFFSQDKEVLAPNGLNWEQDQDLARWGHQVWRGKRVPLASPPAGSVGVYCCLRPIERTFPFEISVLHDFTPQVVPHTHAEKTRSMFQGFYAKALLSSDAALSVSRSTKADAYWLTDMAPEKIAVCHSGPSLCVARHLHSAPVIRRPNVGLVVSTLEPRKNAFFLLEWFRNTSVLPEDTELWWVGPLGWLTSRRQLKQYQNLKGRRIRFLGVATDQKLCELYQTAGWTVYPSLYEGFGFPVLDALRHGAPVLTSYNSSLREFQCPGIWFFDPCDPATLDLAWNTFRTASPVRLPSDDLEGRYNWNRVAQTLLALPEGAGNAQFRPGDDASRPIAA